MSYLLEKVIRGRLREREFIFRKIVFSFQISNTPSTISNNEQAYTKNKANDLKKNSSFNLHVLKMVNLIKK
jgi:hypothetical protein